MRFQREAQATAALNHPHICTLFDVGEHEGAPYLVMEFLQGQTLADELREGPLPLDRLLRIQLGNRTGSRGGPRARHRPPGPEASKRDGYARQELRCLISGWRNSQGRKPAPSPAWGARRTLWARLRICRRSRRVARNWTRAPTCFRWGACCMKRRPEYGRSGGSSVPDTLREIVAHTPAQASTLRPELPPRLGYHPAPGSGEGPQPAVSIGGGAVSGAWKNCGAARSNPQECAWRSGRPVRSSVGRRNCEKLDALLGSAIDGAGRFALVTGEPGIGKTALTGTFVHHARKRNPDILLARGACVEQYGAAEPYLLFLDALGSLLHGPGRERVIATLRQFAPTWCLQFPAIFSSDAMEQLQRDATGASRERMLRELGEALAAMTAETPVILVLEDLHWADPASVDMLRHLGERTRAQRLLVVGTARPEDVERANQPLKNCWAELSTRGVCEEIPLAVLGAEHIVAYLDAHFTPHEFPADFATVIHRKTEGHPLFAVGTVQLLAERGQIVRNNGVWTLAKPLADIALDVPGSMRSLIEKKISLLTERSGRCCCAPASRARSSLPPSWQRLSKGANSSSRRSCTPSRKCTG